MTGTTISRIGFTTHCQKTHRTEVRYHNGRAPRRRYYRFRGWVGCLTVTPGAQRRNGSASFQRFHGARGPSELAASFPTDTSDRPLLTWLRENG